MGGSYNYMVNRDHYRFGCFPDSFHSSVLCYVRSGILEGNSWSDKPLEAKYLTFAANELRQDGTAQDPFPLQLQSSCGSPSSGLA